MKTLLRTIGLSLAVSAALLFASCGKKEAHDEHAGHNHAHGGHGEEKGHGHAETKDGVAMCGEHGVPEAQCAVCNPDAASKLAPGQSMQVRLPSQTSAAIVGVETRPVEAGAMAESVECVAEVLFNQNKLAEITAPAGGIVDSVEVDLGAKVEEGQPLAKLSSAAITEAVSKAVLAHQTVMRERKLRGDRVTSEQALQEAEANYRAAYQQVRAFGFTDEQIASLADHSDEPVYLQVRAPFSGEIIDRTAVRGALVETGKRLFTVVDHSTVWAMLQVPEHLLARIQPGQTVELKIGSISERVFTGKLTWVSPTVDERTRMTRARAEFENPDGLLKDKMFATARILTRKTDLAMLVPAAAVQHIEGKPFVFVKRDADLFDVRAVQLGAKFDGRREILAGLSAGEQVAVAHAFAVKSSMLMSRLGAGCADD
ncbi:MAG: efflux RND transporter periplasmic adaptor subunit [Nibricoccus sp.]